VTALARPDFRRIWLAGLVSDAGDWLLLVSLPILVYQLTGAALGTAYAFLIELVPAVVLAPLAGYLADRIDRRALLIGVSLAQAAALLPLAWWPRLPVIYAVIAVEAALACLFDPAKNALLPTLVEADQLMSANSLIGLNQNLGRLVGGPLGGLLLGLGELRWVVVVDAASFLLAVVLIARVRTAPRRAPSPHPAQPSHRAEPPHRAGPPGSDPASGDAGSGRDVARGGRPLARLTVRAGLLVTAVAAVAQGLFAVLFVVFVARVLGGDAAETGLLRGVQAIGAIGGGLLLVAVKRVPAGRLAGLACLTFGVLALVTWNAPRLTTAEPLYLLLFVAAGAPGVAAVTGIVTVLQSSTMDGERGSVFAALGVATAVGQAAGMLGGGLLGDRLDVVTILDAQGCLYLLAGVLGLVWLTDRAGRTRRRAGQPDRRPAPVAAAPPGT
jgi:MFS family permease